MGEGRQRQSAWLLSVAIERNDGVSRQQWQPDIEGDTTVSENIVRDKNGNVLYRLKEIGPDRTSLRDKNGNQQGYYQSRSNGATEFRDKNGNLISTSR